MTFPLAGNQDQCLRQMDGINRRDCAPHPLLFLLLLLFHISLQCQQYLQRYYRREYRHGAASNAAVVVVADDGAWPIQRARISETVYEGGKEGHYVAFAPLLLLLLLLFLPLLLLFGEELMRRCLAESSE